MLLTGLAVFAAASLTAGLAASAGLLVAARLVQGMGAALMAPAALSELTTSFREGKDRNTALGAWGAISGMAAAAGVFLGGVLSQGPGWRWIFFVNPPICVMVAAGALALLVKDRGVRTRGAAFDSQGAVLVTGGMLWLVAADLTQLIAFTGFFSMFFYATLYMQEILHYSPLKAGAAYLPITAGFAVAGVMASQLVTRIGTRPVVVAGCLIAGAGIYYVSKVPLHGSYVTDLLPGFLVMSLGAGSVFVSVTAAANAGVPPDKAGLAAGLLNSSQQIGSALGLAILSAVAITRTNHLLAAHVSHPLAADAGYHRALLVGGILMAAAAVLALRIGNTRKAAPLVMVSTESHPGQNGHALGDAGRPARQHLYPDK